MFLFFWAFQLCSSFSFSQSLTTILPKNNFTTSDSTILFSWNTSALYNSYKLEISSDNNFTSIIHIGPPTTNDTDSANFISSGNYFWRVKAYTPLNDSIISNSSKITFFSPSDIPGLAVWYNPDNGLDSVNYKLTQWNDLSGNNHHAVQTDTSKSPTIIPAGLNGHSLIKFDGSNDILNINDSISFNMFFFVSAWTPIESNFTSYYTLASCDNPTAKSQLLITRGGTPDIYDGGFYGDSIWMNGSRSLTYLNNNTYNLTQGFRSAYSTYTGTQKLRIGWCNYYDQWNGPIQEVIFYDHLVYDQTTIDHINNYLYDKYAPPVDLGADVYTTGFCGIQITPVNPNGNKYSFLWSTGETSDTITVSQSGTYWVQATNVFGQISYDTIEVHYPQIASFSDTTFCLGNTVTWDTQFDHANYSFLWNDSSTDSLIHISQSGQYFVTVSDTSGCSTTSYTITATRDDLANNISLGNDTSMCAGNYITLLSGNGPNMTYLWNDSSTDDTLFVNISGQYNISVTDANQCVAKDTINVNISGQAPIAGFDHLTACANNSVSFSDTSFTTDGSNIVQWFWNFGDNSTSGDTAIIQTPNYVFPDSGSYTITLTVTTDAGCEQAIAKTIYVNPLPSLDLGPDTALCSGNSITPASATGNGLSYLWGDGSTNDSLTIITAGTYSLTVTSAIGCSISDSINVTISGQAPSANFSYSTICKNSPVQFTDISSPPAGNTITGWYWELTDTTSMSQNFAYTYPDSGMYTVSLTVYTDAGCKQSINKEVHVYPTPNITFLSSAPICQNDSTLFASSSTDNGYSPLSYSWNFGDAVSGANNVSTLSSPSHLFSQQGTFTVTLIGSIPEGCKDSIKKTVTVLQQVKADFNYTTACVGTPVHLTDNSIVPSPNNSNVRHWLIESNNYTGTSVYYTFTSGGNYDVTLVVTGNNSCTSTISKTIQVITPPAVQFSQANLCVNDTAIPANTTIIQDKGIEYWKWYLNNSLASGIQNPLFTGLTSGSYDLKLLAIDSMGCKDSTNHTFSVFDLPAANFTSTPDSFSYTGIPTIFSYTGNDAISYNWSINNQTYTGNPVSHTFDSTGVYTISLEISDSNNCINASSKNLDILTYRLDLAVIAVRASLDPDNFISVETDLSNLGSVPVSSFDISYHTSNASAVKESWSGTPSNSLFFTYKFNAQTQLLENSDNMITCVIIESVNQTQDGNASNNSLCIASDLEHPSVLEPFPSPATSYIIVPVILTETLDITLSTYDALGQNALLEKNYTGVQGLNLIQLPVEELSEGAYFIHISIGSKSFIKKFAKIN